MSLTLHATGTSQLLTAPWVKGLAGLTLPGFQSKDSGTSVSYTTQSNHYRRVDIDYIPYLLIFVIFYFLISDVDGDDDDQGGGMMIPSYNPTQ